MSHIKKSIVLVAFLSLVILVPTLYAASEGAQKSTEPAKNQNLAGLHKQAACTSCHGKNLVPDDNETVLNRQCISCHGTLTQLAAKSRAAVNAHQSHLGEINCTACHNGHGPSRAYCLNCHSFDMKIPGAQGTEASPVVRSTRKPTTDKTDIVIIGSGAAGFTAAITAHELGAKVILLDKQPITGGNSMLAAGGMNAAETRFQKAKGINDSWELMFKDTMTGGKNLADPELVKILAKNSASSVDWLTGLGADVSDVGRLAGASVARAHRPTGGAAVGAHITGVLKKNAADRKIDVRVNSKVIKILENKKGRVTGVMVQGKHRKTYTIEAKCVIDTAGGFSASPRKVALYKPEYAGMTTSNQPGATGDGMDLGADAGGRLIDMEQVQIHPTVAVGSRTLITEGVRGNGAILVNHGGKRFVNELTTRDAASAAVLAQPGKTAFLVFDEGIRKSLKQIEGYFHLELVKEGATVAELASKIKVPADALAATLEDYNKAYEAKSDAEFKRPDMPRPVNTPKFYAIEVMPGIHYTMGGLKFTTQTQVVGKNGKPIPGLFAAGEVTGGVHGANRLGGNSISETITFGRIAGANAAAFAKKAGQK